MEESKVSSLKSESSAPEPSSAKQIRRDLVSQLFFAQSPIFQLPFSFYLLPFTFHLLAHACSLPVPSLAFQVPSLDLSFIFHASANFLRFCPLHSFLTSERRIFVVVVVSLSSSFLYCMKDLRGSANRKMPFTRLASLKP